MESDRIIVIVLVSLMFASYLIVEFVVIEPAKRLETMTFSHDVENETAPQTTNSTLNQTIVNGELP